MREESQSCERVKGVVWGLNNSPECQRPGFRFQALQRQTKTKKKLQKRPDGKQERGSLERSSRGTDCDCCIENVTNPVTPGLWCSLKQSLFQEHFPYHDPHHLPCVSQKLCIFVLLLCEHHDQKQLGNSEVYFAYTFISQFIIRGVWARTHQAGHAPGAELRQRHGQGCSLACPHGLFTHWLVLTACSFCFLTASGPSAQRWRCPQGAEQSVTALQAYLQPDLMVTIFQLRVPPPRWHKVGIKLTLTSVIPKRPSLTESSLRDSHPAFGGICMHTDKDVLSVGRAAEHKVHSPFTYSWYTRCEGDFHGIFNSLAHEVKLNGIGLLTVSNQTSKGFGCWTQF